MYIMIIFCMINDIYNVIFCMFCFNSSPKYRNAFFAVLTNYKNFAKSRYISFAKRHVTSPWKVINMYCDNSWKFMIFVIVKYWWVTFWLLNSIAPRWFCCCCFYFNIEFPTKINKVFWRKFTSIIAKHWDWSPAYTYPLFRKILYNIWLFTFYNNAVTKSRKFIYETQIPKISTELIKIHCNHFVKI